MASRRRGSVFLRGKVYYIKYSLLGRQRMERAGPKRADADRLLAQRLTELDEGQFRVGRIISFDSFLDRFWREHVEVAGLKPATTSAYASIIRRHLIPYFGPMRMDRITPAIIQRFVAETLSRTSEATGAKLSPKTFRNTLRLVAKIFVCAVDWRVITRTPVERITLPRAQEREMEFLRPDEVRRLLAAAPDEVTRCLLMTAVFTGLRQGELLALEWKHVDLENRVIQVRQAFSKRELLRPKTRNGVRDVRIGRNLVVMLEAHRVRAAADATFVFTNKEGKPLDPSNLVKRLFQPTLEAAGLRKIRWHDLRHTFASLLLNDGVNIKFLSSQLGHASVQLTLDRYAHLMPEQHDDAVDRLDAIAQTITDPPAPEEL